MDRSQFRSSKPNTPAQPVAPSTASVSPSVARPMQHSKTKPSKGKWFKGSVIAVAILAGFAVWQYIGQDLFAGVRMNKYQAVFLSNGQVYFGKLHGVGGSYMQLTDVYYLEGTAGEVQTSSDANTEATPAQTAQQLAKLGKELHKPDDKMIIKSDQVVFFENIADDGAVGKAIKEYKDKK